MPVFRRTGAAWLPNLPPHAGRTPPGHGGTAVAQAAELRDAVAGPAAAAGPLLRRNCPPGGDQGRVRGAAVRVLPGYPPHYRRDAAAARGNRKSPAARREA